MQPAIFIDRDGVIIENRANYVRSWADVEILPEAVEALRLASSSKFKIVIVTNQSGIGKGLIPPGTARRINRRLLKIITDGGGRIDGIYVCPHTPDDHCACRKPKPGLLLTAAKDLAIDLSQSIMIGDALTDIQAGQQAGVAASILVLTGRGAEQSRLPAASSLPEFQIYPSLFSAITCLLDGDNRPSGEST
jgi:D-glycero-D-manno-heptose 1,7-bisphosphate phosphatase